MTNEECCAQVREAQNRSMTVGDNLLVVAQVVCPPSDTMVVVPVDRLHFGRTWGVLCCAVEGQEGHRYFRGPVSMVVGRVTCRNPLDIVTKGDSVGVAMERRALAGLVDPQSRNSEKCDWATVGVQHRPMHGTAAQEVHHSHWNAFVGVRPGHRAQRAGAKEHRQVSLHVALHVLVIAGDLEIGDFDAMAVGESRALGLREAVRVVWAHRLLSALQPVVQQP